MLNSPLLLVVLTLSHCFCCYSLLCTGTSSQLLRSTQFVLVSATEPTTAAYAELFVPKGGKLQLFVPEISPGVPQLWTVRKCNGYSTADGLDPSEEWCGSHMWEESCFCNDTEYTTGGCCVGPQYKTYGIFNGAMIGVINDGGYDSTFNGSTVNDDEWIFFGSKFCQSFFSDTNITVYFKITDSNAGSFGDNYGTMNVTVDVYNGCPTGFTWVADPSEDPPSDGNCIQHTDNLVVTNSPLLLTSVLDIKYNLSLTSVGILEASALIFSQDSFLILQINNSSKDNLDSSITINGCVNFGGAKLVIDVNVTEFQPNTTIPIMEFNCSVGNFSEIITTGNACISSSPIYKATSLFLQFEDICGSQPNNNNIVLIASVAGVVGAVGIAVIVLVVWIFHRNYMLGKSMTSIKGSITGSKDSMNSKPEQ